jgi:hypothetical protein
MLTSIIMCLMTKAVPARCGCYFYSSFAQIYETQTKIDKFCCCEVQIANDIMCVEDVCLVDETKDRLEFQ